MKNQHKIILLFPFLLLLSCNKNNQNPEGRCLSANFFSEYPARNFKMGFTSWPFGPKPEDVTATYDFIENNTDIYAEHIDNNIPWQAWMNDTALPAEFINSIDSRVAKRIRDKYLLVSVSLLNQERSDLAPDYDGKTPTYTQMNDKAIEDAYVKHVSYIIDRLQPDYLVIAIEVNELKVHSKAKWAEYKALIGGVKNRVRQRYPKLPISESITLHTLYQPNVDDPTSYIEEVVSYMNTMDFVSISFYPFFRDLYSREELQKAFDFLHNEISRPIAFAETAQLTGDLVVSSFGLNIKGDECGQNIYLETLLTNARQQNYKFIIWWAYKDFDALWETFPEELKDLGRLWRDTGLIDENDRNRMARTTWDIVLKK